MTTAASSATLPATLRLGPVHLTVTDVDRSVQFYERSIGLRTHRRDNARSADVGAGGARSAALGAGGEDLLVLVEQPDARPAGRHAGLYHFALLHPSRLELARAARRLIATRTPVSGASDHKISEAIYLPDPDGNGVELAADRPRERWGDLSDPTAVGPDPLDMPGLMVLVEGEEARAEASPDLKVGHLHLHVGDIDRALAFWRDGVGFEVMTRFPSAAFIAAGGYHHHLGLNTWRGEGVPPQPDGVVGLRHWTILLDDPAEVAAVRERVEATGAEVEEVPGGFRSRDPYRNAVAVIS
ncbi:MAG TPA: VOC family protein [Thermoleophilaceae bacterium]|nr:VOC family protein [Thermoleophilaceae bacterium]